MDRTVLLSLKLWLNGVNDLSRTYLAHHELESDLIITIILMA